MSAVGAVVAKTQDGHNAAEHASAASLLAVVMKGSNKKDKHLSQGHLDAPLLEDGFTSGQKRKCALDVRAAR